MTLRLEPEGDDELPVSSHGMIFGQTRWGRTSWTKWSIRRLLAGTPPVVATDEQGEYDGGAQ